MCVVGFLVKKVHNQHLAFLIVIPVIGTVSHAVLLFFMRIGMKDEK